MALCEIRLMTLKIPQKQTNKQTNKQSKKKRVRLAKFDWSVHVICVKSLSKVTLNYLTEVWSAMCDIGIS